MTCADCRHWRQSRQTPKFGECHRYPPQIVPMMGYEEEPGKPARFYYKSKTRWPTTPAEATCGEASE